MNEPISTPLATPVQANTKMSIMKLVAIGGTIVLVLVAAVVIIMIAGRSSDTSSAQSGATAASAANATTGGSAPADQQSAQTPVDKTVAASYFGDWHGADGTIITLYDDGLGNYKTKTQRVTGGKIDLNEKAKTLKITGMLNISKTWKIDQAPRGTDNAKEMTLDGVVYRGTAAHNLQIWMDTTFTTSSAPDNSSKPLPLPSQAELVGMVGQSILSFNEALRTKDFEPFYRIISHRWQTETTPAMLANDYAAMAERKLDFSPVASSVPKLHPEPFVSGTGMLIVEGSYPVEPRIVFRISYVTDNSTWKLATLWANVVDAGE